MGDDPASTATDIAKATLKGPDKSRYVPRLPFGIVLVPVTSGGQVAPINVGFLNVHNSAPFKVARPVVVAANWTMALCIASATWLTVAHHGGVSTLALFIFILILDSESTPGRHMRSRLAKAYPGSFGSSRRRARSIAKASTLTSPRIKSAMLDSPTVATLTPPAPSKQAGSTKAKPAA